MHRRLLALLGVGALQAPRTLRPDAFWVKTSLTVAGLLRLKENVVPTGVRLIFACWWPRRHLLADWPSSVRVGLPARCSAARSGSGRCRARLSPRA